MEIDKEKEKQDYLRIFTLLHKGAPKIDYLRAIIKVFICNMPKIYNTWKNIPTAKKHLGQFYPTCGFFLQNITV